MCCGGSTEFTVIRSERLPPALLACPDRDRPSSGSEIQIERAREHRELAMRELPDEAFRLGRGDPVLPTIFE